MTSSFILLACQTHVVCLPEFSIIVIARCPHGYVLLCFAAGNYSDSGMQHPAICQIHTATRREAEGVHAANANVF